MNMHGEILGTTPDELSLLMVHYGAKRGISAIFFLSVFSRLYRQRKILPMAMHLLYDSRSLLRIGKTNVLGAGEVAFVPVWSYFF